MIHLFDSEVREKSVRKLEREREGVIRLLLHGRSSYTKRPQWVHINGILLCGISLIYYYIYMYMNDLIVDDIIHKCMTR